MVHFQNISCAYREFKETVFYGRIKVEFIKTTIHPLNYTIGCINNILCNGSATDLQTKNQNEKIKHGFVGNSFHCQLL